MNSLEVIGRPLLKADAKALAKGKSAGLLSIPDQIEKEIKAYLWWQTVS